MIYVILAAVYSAYMIGIMLIIAAAVSRAVFGNGKIKQSLKDILLAFAWPLMLPSAEGRKKLKQTIGRYI